MTVAATTHPAITSTASARADANLDPRRIGTTVTRYYLQHLTSAVFPICAGAALYGWRALIALLIVVGSAMVALWAWRFIGRKGRQLHAAHVFWHAMLLGLMLPAHLATDAAASRPTQLVMILGGAGVTIVIMNWILGGLGSGRIHPVLVTYLLMEVLFSPALASNRVLQRNRIFSGDLLNAPGVPQVATPAGPWVQAPSSTGTFHAHRMYRAAQRLQQFTTSAAPGGQWLTLDVLIRDHLPPLEDLIIGGQPAPIGLGSGIAILVGGLFLLYRGIIDYRIPLLVFIAAYFTILIAPLPVQVHDEPTYHWLLVRWVDLEMALTFVHYELLASPLLFIAIYLATASAIRPLTKGARSIYAITVGVLAAVAQLYLSMSWGPYLALLIASLLTPMFDKRFGPKPLV